VWVLSDAGFAIIAVIVAVISVIVVIIIAEKIVAAVYVTC